jgi:hypothetical protein
MAATIHKRASAQHDLVEDYVYLAEHAGIDTAERFFASAAFCDIGATASSKRPSGG